MLPTEATNLPGLLRALSYPPDIRDIILQTAVASPKGCEAKVPVAKLLMDDLVASSEMPRDSASASVGLLPHLKRSLAFTLGVSRDAEVLKFVLERLILGGQKDDFGLRVVDKGTLLRRVVRSSVVGFSVARAQMDTYANSHNGEELLHTVIGQHAELARSSESGELPDWWMRVVKDEQLRHAVQLEREGEKAAVELLCRGV
jgi:hypothetical protein